MGNEIFLGDLVDTLKSARMNPRKCIIRSISFCTLDKNSGRIKADKWKVKRKRELEFHSKDSVINLDTMIKKIESFIHENVLDNYIISEVSHTYITPSTLEVNIIEKTD